MVKVYFTNGKDASVRAAVSVVPQHIDRATPGITCQDADGNEVAQFRLTEVVGWEVRSEELAPGEVLKMNT